jgi:hypothetical protein
VYAKLKGGKPQYKSEDADHCHRDHHWNAENAQTRLFCLLIPLYRQILVFVCLVEEANDLAGNVLSSGLLVVHDTSRGGEDDIAELTGRQQLDDPLLEIGQADVVAGGDDTSLVETIHGQVRQRSCAVLPLSKGDLPAVKLDDNLARAVVVDLLELANVACKENIVSNVAEDLRRLVT